MFRIHSQKAAIFCLPWLAWVGPEVLAVIDIIITIAATVFVDSQDDNSTMKKWEMQEARHWLWAGFGISFIISLIVFGTLSTLTPLGCWFNSSNKQ